MKTYGFLTSLINNYAWLSNTAATYYCLAAILNDNIVIILI